MVDLPGRSAYEPEDRADPPDDAVESGTDGWGSPLPAEYGSLHAVRPPERSSPEPGAGVGGGLFSAWARTGGRRPAADGRNSPAPGPGPGPGPEATVRPFRGTTTASSSRPGAEGGFSSSNDPTGVMPVVGRDSTGPAAGSSGPAAAGPGGAGAGAGAAAAEPVAPRRSAVEPAPPAAGAASESWVPGGDPSMTSVLPGAGAGVAGAGLAGAGPGLAGAGIAPGGTGLAPGDGARPPLGRPGAPLRPARRPGRARSRVVLRHLDVSTVAKVSVIFYLVVLVIIVVAAVLLWAAATSFGTLPSIEKSVRTLFSLRSFKLHVGAVAMYTGAAGVIIAIVGTIANILLAMVYNLIADVVGGIRVELESFSRD